MVLEEDAPLLRHQSYLLGLRGRYGSGTKAEGPPITLNTGIGHAESVLEISADGSLSWRADFSRRIWIPRSSGPPIVVTTADCSLTVYRSRVWTHLWLVLWEQPHDPFPAGTGLRRSGARLTSHRRCGS